MAKGKTAAATASSWAGDLMEHILTHHRGLFAVLFLLPLSLVYSVLLAVRNKISFYLASAPAKHAQRVADVQRQVRGWNADGCEQRMCTARPGWQTMSLRVGRYKKTLRNIHIPLCDVLEVDQEREVVRVEPLVSMGQITATLNPLGWTLAVVPELDDLTVGGLIAGFGVESSSHVHGLFQYTCVSFEVVLGDGEVVKCSKDENPELFHSIPWSYGTLGFLVAAEIKIVRAKKWVKLEYLPCHSQQQYCELFEKESRKEKPADFVEGLVYSKDKAVIMLGTLCDSAEWWKINRIGNYYKPWFYKHVERFLSSGPATEYLPLRDYYHRHTRSIFWELADIIPFGNNPVFRALCGWMVPPKISLLKLTQTETTRKLYELNHVVQDMLVPIKDLAKSIDVFHEEFNLYPLWLCPMGVYKNPHGGFLRALPDGDDMFVDIGAYGNPTTKNFHFRDTARRVEEHVRKVKGFQALYADTYMDRAEFREMFDHTLYDKLRKQHNAEKAFPEVYDKISKAARL